MGSHRCKPRLCNVEPQVRGKLRGRRRLCAGGARRSGCSSSRSALERHTNLLLVLLQNLRSGKWCKNQRSENGTCIPESLLETGLKISRFDKGLYRTCSMSDNRKNKIKETYRLQVCQGPDQAVRPAYLEACWRRPSRLGRVHF